MGDFFTFLLSLSVLMPLIAVLFKIKKLPVNWYPFVILILVAFAAEAVSFGLIHFLKGGNAVVIKVYSLIECLLIVYQFYLWRQITSEKVYRILSAACLLFWLIESILFTNLNTFSPYFRVFYAFLIVLLSINHINTIIVRQDLSLIRNPRFVLSLAFIIFFIYQIVYEAAFYIGADKFVLSNRIITGFGYINFGVNFLYALVILLIDSREFKSEDSYMTR
jgi:hypothetical protein